MRLYWIILLVSLFSNYSIAGENNWGISKIIEEKYEDGPFKGITKKTDVIFTNGKTLTTLVVEFKLLASFITSQGIPFIIFSGRTCIECDVRTTIHIHSPLKEKYDGDTPYSYPGKLHDVYDNSIVYEDSRAFYGQCKESNEYSVIWYSNYLGKDKKWHDSIFEVELVGEDAKGSSIKYSKDLISITLNKIENGLCYELQGKERRTMP